ncbi:MAG: hypothetical protein O7A69_02555 [SAR324 cluster bacterium]|nr:hypothetical protein [SAR324 cluster bacterium]
MLQDWLQGLADLIFSLFGEQGRFIYQEYPFLFWLLVTGLGLVPAGLSLYLLLRVYLAVSGAVRRLREDLTRGFSLLYTRDGRRGLRLAREIRRGSDRVRRILLSAGGEAREHESLRQLLDKFVHLELPDTLAQAQTFIETGGAAPAKRLSRQLQRQEAAWTETADGSAREALQKDIAATRQKLAQVNHSNEACAQLLKGLEEAVLALRTLELEIASLGATRSQALSQLRDHLSEMAEELHHQREAHLSFQDDS